MIKLTVRIGEIDLPAVAYCREMDCSGIGEDKYEALDSLVEVIKQNWRVKDATHMLREGKPT